MKSKKKTEKFKCLMCSAKFEVSQDVWKKFNDDIESGQHTDDIEPIKCPTCQDSRIQHLNPVQVEKIEVKNIFDNISTRFGVFFARLLAPIIFLWGESSLGAFITLFEFIFFILSVLAVNYFFKLDFIYSSTIVLVYRMINLIKKRIV